MSAAREVIANAEDLKLNAVAKLPALLAEHEPLTAVALWFDRVADYAKVKRGVFAAVEQAVWQGLPAHSRGPICDALNVGRRRLLEAGKAGGTIRSDVDARDVILLIGYLARLDEAEWDTRARHLLHIVLDGCASRRPAKRGRSVS
jgi:hypothetical protein